MTDKPESLPEQDGQSPPLLTAAPVAREVTRHWEEFVKHVKAHKRWMALVLQLCAMTSDEGDELVLRFNNPSDGKLLQEPDNLKLLQGFARDFFQRELRVVIREHNAPAPGESSEGGEAERRALTNEPLVQMAAEIFGGQVGSIRPKG